MMGLAYLGLLRGGGKWVAHDNVVADGRRAAGD